jgi:hypothetical protein
LVWLGVFLKSLARDLQQLLLLVEVRVEKQVHQALVVTVAVVVAQWVLLALLVQATRQAHLQVKETTAELVLQTA